MPAAHESPAGTAPSVLLVEEYDALAAAITSALKKFAPDHRVRAVDSLAEAEARVIEISPALLIVDFDPPRPDAIEFLDRIAAANPDARFLAIASGVPLELNSERHGATAIQFIEKPFELSEFGAAVQALLGPWTHPASGDSRGTLRDLGASDLIPLQCLNLATAILHLRSGDDRRGEIHFVDGQIAHAATGNFTGVGALHQIVRWKNVHAKESERLVDAPRTIHGSWQNNFLDALAHAAPAQEESVPPPVPVSTPEPPPPKPAVKTGKKIVVIDDTEMLLIFVEDALGTADPSLQIVTAFTGSEGLRRTEVMLPDLVLLDYSLPDLRGDQVCERLLQNETTARVPVVMMSGHVSEMAATARKYRNVVATIEKPFRSEALVTLVREALTKGPLPTKISERPGNGQKSPKKNGRGAAMEPVAPAAPPPQPPPIVTEPTPPPSPPAVSPPPPTPSVSPSPPRITSLAGANGSSVVLGLGMEVVAVQFTPRFQIGAIRARPTASTLSLTHSSAPAENLLAGFEIGPVELDATGQIRTMRVLPTRQPAKAVQTRNQLVITDLALVNQNASIQVTAGAAAPMTMQLIAQFKVAGVELSDRFEVAQLVLQPAGTRVRVILDPQSRAVSEFETAQVRLDPSQRIAEFVLNAAAPT
ncbi:MAG TPA: response regulator [Chthoniobacterales bacterium]|nr:response regulator [Chthoniobacterales bacterium]